MSKLIGNCADVIDLPKLIKQLEQIESPIVTRGDQYCFGIKQIPGTPEDAYTTGVYNDWLNAGYNMSSANLTLYKSEHFGQEFEDAVVKLLNITSPLTRSEISCLRPGDMAPWHKDHGTDRNIVRIHIHVSDQQPGSFLMIDDDIFHSMRQGDIVQWDNKMQSHAAVNCSPEPNYLYHIEYYA
jgi:hypothetical protein